MEALASFSSTNWMGERLDGWGAPGDTSHGVVVEDPEELWMAPNPDLDSMGAPDDLDMPSASSSGSISSLDAAGPAGGAGGRVSGNGSTLIGSLDAVGPGGDAGADVGIGAASAAAAPGAGTDVGTELCEVCGSGADDANMLLCDSCPEGYHIYCLTPPLQAIPEGDWHCHKCEALGARTLVLEKADAMSCARRWYDTQSVFGTDHGLKMVPHTAYKNSALEWSVEYSTMPASPGQPYLIRVRYEPERHGEYWTWKAVLFTEEGASKHPDKTGSPNQVTADQPAEYTVERIIDMRRKQGRWEFKVKWKGYGLGDATWQGSHSFHEDSVWKSMIAKVEGVIEQAQATEAEALKALRKSSWEICDAVARITRDHDEALARQLQREAGGLRQGSRRQVVDEDPMIAESRSVTKALKSATGVKKTPWPPSVWKEGYKCDVKDVEGQWYEGTVVLVTLPHVKIRFKGFSDKFNEWKRVNPAPDKEKMAPLGSMTNPPAPSSSSSSSSSTSTSAAASSTSAVAAAASAAATTSPRKRKAPESAAAGTVPAAAAVAAPAAKRSKTAAASRAPTKPAKVASTKHVKKEPDPSTVAVAESVASPKQVDKPDKPARPPEDFLAEIQGKTREQRLKFWNKQRLVPLQTACKERGIWAGGSRAHMRDRLLKFEFERESLTDHDLSGLEATSTASAASAAQQGSIVEIQGHVEYVIEQVLDMKKGADGSWRFRVKWYNFPASENSWEPRESFNSKSMWSGFPKKLLKVMNKSGANEETALSALQKSSWDKSAALKLLQNEQEKNESKADKTESVTSPISASDSDPPVVKVKRKASAGPIVIPEGSDSDEPEGDEPRKIYDDGFGSDFYGDADDRKKLDAMTAMERETILLDRQEARERQAERAQAKRRLEREKEKQKQEQKHKQKQEQKQKQKNEKEQKKKKRTSAEKHPLALETVAREAADNRLRFRGHPIICSDCGTQSGERLRRGLCADGKVYCDRCSPGAATTSTTNDASPTIRESTSEGARKIPRKNHDPSHASADAFDSGGNFGSASASRDPRERPDRSGERNHERDRDRARDRSRGAERPHSRSDAGPSGYRGHDTPHRAEGQCMKAPRAGGPEFGFIKSPALDHDIFFHRSAAFNGIKVSDCVTFTIGRNKKGPIALEVRLAPTQPLRSSSPTMLRPSTQISPRANAASGSIPLTVEQLRGELDLKRESKRSNSERFFLRHFAAVQRVWGNRTILRNAGPRKANDATVEQVWQCLLDGDCEDFDPSIVNHVAAWKMAEGPEGFSDEAFLRLVQVKKRQQRGLERRMGRPVSGKVWTGLEGAACEIELIDKAYSMQQIAIPGRGVSCSHPRCFDMRTHIKEMIKKDRRKIWDQACAKLIADFVESLTAKHTDPERVKAANGMLREAFNQLPTPSGSKMPPGVEMMSGEAPQFFESLMKFESTDPRWHGMINEAFREFWFGLRGRRWRDSYKLGPWFVQAGARPMGEWGCPFCPGQKSSSSTAGWMELVIDETLESLIDQATQKCQGTQAVDVRCCGGAEADEGLRCGAVPLLVCGSRSGHVLAWSAEQDDSDDEEEVDLT